MKLAEYAEEKKLTEEAVKEALKATGQAVHPNWNVDEAKLDEYFSNKTNTASGESRNAEVQPVKPDPQVEVVVAPTAAPAAEGLVIEVPKERPKSENAIFGRYEDGMKIFKLVPLGSKDVTAQEFLSYGHDESQAISNIVSAVPALKHNRANWQVKGTVPFTIKHV